MKPRRKAFASAMGPGLLAGMLCGMSLALSAGTLPLPATGASVEESRVEKTYHVDAANPDAADDDKHGTPEAPFATISYACQTAARDKDHHLGARVLVAAGTYREAIEISPPPGGAADTDAPLILESAERGQTIIDGADAAGWTASTWKTEGTNWTHPWPFRRIQPAPSARARGPSAASTPPGASSAVYQRGDLLFVNGLLLRQVNRLEDLAPGCFWEHEPPPAPARRGKETATPSGPPEGAAAVIVQPPPDTSLEGAIIQVGARGRGLAIRGRRNVVVRGFLLQHAAEPANGEASTAGLLLDGCSNVLVEDVYSQWNDGAGLVILGRAASPGSGAFTLRQVHLLHNGGSGLAVYNVANLLVEDSEASFNNFRGEWADWIDFSGAAGVKTRSVHGSTWRRLRAVGNFCRGVWWDDDNSDATLEEGTVRGNVIGGVLINHDPGPVLLRRCLVTETKNRPGVREETVWPGGVSVVATPDVTLESNVVAANAVAQLALWDVADANPVGNRAPHPVVRDVRHAYHHNVFYAADSSQSVCSVPGIDAGTKGGWASYYETLDTGENCFWDPARAEGFCLRGNAPKPAGDDASADGRMNVKLEDWEKYLSSRSRPKDAASPPDDKPPEAGSLWQDPLFANPAEGDFQVREQSPAANWNLPADEGSTAP